MANLCKHPSAYTDNLVQHHLVNMLTRVASHKKDDGRKAVLLAWCSALIPAIVRRHQTSILLLATIAARHASDAERITRSTDAKGFRSWASSSNDSKVGGRAPSRAAFRWVRSPNGWVKAAFGSTVAEEEVQDELAEDDTFCYDVGNDLDDSGSALWTIPVSIPLGPQAAVDQVANDWAKLWEENAQYSAVVPTRPSESRRLIVGVDIREAALTFPIHTGLGGDNFAPRAFERLETEATDAFSFALQPHGGQGGLGQGSSSWS